MSAQIRPLPVEAASQRTENGAVKNKTESPDGFDCLLCHQLGGEPRELPSEKRQAKTEVGKDEDSSAWTLLGVQTGRLILPLPPSVTSTAETASPKSIVPSGSETAASDAALTEASIDTILANVSTPESPFSTAPGSIAMPAELPKADESALPSIPAIPQNEKLVTTDSASFEIDSSLLEASPSVAIDPAADPKRSLPRKAGEQASPATTVTASRNEKDFPALAKAELAEFAVPISKAPEKLDGITAAKQTTMLFTPEKSAAPSSQEPKPVFIPTAQLADEKITPLVRLSGKNIEPTRIASVEALPLNVTVQIDSRFEVAPVTESPKLPEIRGVELVKAIEQQVHVIRATRLNELQVIIRPDSHTELYLHIRNDAGQLHLEARCDRGDFRWLESQWSAVQSSLGAQGVRVEPLEAAFRSQTSPAQHEAFSNDSDRQRQPARNGHDPFSEQEPRRSISNQKALTGSPARGRGWQSWA